MEVSDDLLEYIADMPDDNLLEISNFVLVDSNHNNNEENLMFFDSNRYLLSLCRSPFSKLNSDSSLLIIVPL